MKTTKKYSAQGQPIVVRGKSICEIQELVDLLVNKYDFSAKRPITEGGHFNDRGGSCPWLFVNVEGRSFRIGRAGICFAKPVFNRWLTVEGFLDILDIVYGSEKIDKTLS